MECRLRAEIRQTAEESALSTRHVVELTVARPGFPQPFFGDVLASGVVQVFKTL